MRSRIFSTALWRLKRRSAPARRPGSTRRTSRRQAQTLTDRLELRLADIARQRDIAPLSPEICGAALVIPAAVLAPEKTEPETASGAAESADAATRAEVEARAMDAVMERERSLGRAPRDVSAEDRGYDIESREPDTGRLRFIEVKGRRADARTVTVTRNEILAAFNAAESFILAVVLVEGRFRPSAALSAESGASVRPRARIRRGFAVALGGEDKKAVRRQAVTCDRTRRPRVKDLL